MLQLTKENFEKAVDFIHSQARELDKQLFAYYFEGGTAVSVLNALVHYQNEDGGFGNALEPDFRLKGSSPMATSVGLQYCTAVGADADHPIVQNAVRYLLATYNLEHDYWPATFEDVNDAPHAFWWHVDALEPPDDSRWPNPSAELIGYLNRYANLVPSDFLARVKARAQANLDSSAIRKGDVGQKYNWLCWQRAARFLPQEMGTTVATIIGDAFTALAPIQTDTFGEIGLLEFAPTPDSALGQLAPEAIQQALDTAISQQAADGGWYPAWHWGQYEEVWPIAKQEWAGKITAETLHKLRDFGRIEGLG